MHRLSLAFLAGLLLFQTDALGGFGRDKCAPDMRKLVWTRTILERSLPKGVEIVDRVWLANPTPTELVIYSREKGAAKRTGYREILGPVPTTADELPMTKLVSGERYEYHYPENPTFSEDGKASRAGWARQDYAAALIEGKTPTIPPKIEDRLFSGRLKGLPITVKTPYYYGKKRGEIEMVYAFTRNPKYGWKDPSCATPSPSPSP